MANMMFAGDRVPYKHVEAYQQMLEVQPAHRQVAHAYWADKIAEVMRDPSGIKPKLILTLIRYHILLHMI